MATFFRSYEDCLPKENIDYFKKLDKLNKTQPQKKQIELKPDRTIEFSNQILKTLSKHYAYPVWESLNTQEILNIYTNTLNEQWRERYDKMSAFGKPKISEEDLDYEDLWF